MSTPQVQLTPMQALTNAVSNLGVALRNRKATGVAAVEAVGVVVELKQGLATAEADVVSTTKALNLHNPLVSEAKQQIISAVSSIS